MNGAGDISITGNRRPVSYYREIVFGLAKQPCIAVQAPASYGIPRNFGPWCYTDCTFSYSYEGEEGKPVMIQVYGGGDSVELFVNGKSLGVQPCGHETGYETQFHTIYEPGELTAVAYENGQEIGRTTLRTAGKPVTTALMAEKYDTLVFVNIDVVDENGLLRADARIPLFRLCGRGCQASGIRRYEGITPERIRAGGYHFRRGACPRGSQENRRQRQDQSDRDGSRS